MLKNYIAAKLRSINNNKKTSKRKPIKEIEQKVYSFSFIV